MHLLYGVVGEGMGHATRSRVILEHLLEAGHQLTVVVSGRAHGFLRQKLEGRAGIRIFEIHGLHLKFEGNDLDLDKSIFSNMAAAPEGLRKNLKVWLELLGDVGAGDDIDAVISDFESFAWLYGRVRKLPVISIDNMQVLNRCEHDAFASDDKAFDFTMARLAVKAKLPGAYHYLVSSFFFPRVKKPKTTLVPPILRPEILNAKREPGEHVLIYQTAAANADTLLSILNTLPHTFKAYGTGREGQFGNVTCCGFSETGFVDDLRTARCVVAGGGYSLMGEAVHLHVPLYAIPIQGQYEQELNARYLELLGYGRFDDEVTAEGIARFIDDAPTMQKALERYTPRSNDMLFGCLDELLRHIDLKEPPPDNLTAKNLGSYDDDGARLPAALRRVLRGEPG